MSSHSKGAITEIEDLQNLMLLGCPVVIWDIDMNTIRTAKPDGIKAAKGGLIIFFETDGIGQYLRWYGFNDPSYNGAVNDASMYMFIDRKYAYAAQNKHRRKGQIK